MSYKIPRIEFKNEIHEAFANIYMYACSIVASSCYHDDSGVWYDTSKRFTKKNNHFTLIYQPKKGFDEYETGDIALIIKKNNEKLNNKFIKEVQYITDYIDFLVCKSFNLILEGTENKWCEDVKPKNFIELMEITKPLNFKPNGTISFTFTIRGYNSNKCHIEWEPFLIDLLEKNKLNNNEIKKFVQSVIDNDCCEYDFEKDSEPIDVDTQYKHLFKGTKRTREYSSDDSPSKKQSL